MPVHDSYEDVAVWESIRHKVERETAALVDALEEEIPNDDLLRRYQREKPIPYQLSRIMEQRSDAWIQRVYGICCDAWGRPISPGLNRMIWTFAVQPFIDKHLYDLLLRAAGIRFPPSRDRLSKLLGSLPRPGAPQATKWVPIPSPAGPEVDERHLVTVDQRMCCVEIKGKISELWRKKLVLGRSDHPQIAEAAAMAPAQEREAQAMGVATGQPPVSLSAPAVQAGSVDARATPDPRVSGFYARLSSSCQPAPQKPSAADSKPAAPSALPVKHDVAPAAEERRAEPLEQTESQESRAARRPALEAEFSSERALTNKFSTDGDVCSTSYKGKATVRKHSIGMRYLQELIRYAGLSIHSDKLVALERTAAFIPYSVDDLESQSEPEQEQFDQEAIRSIDDRIRERVPLVLAARRANEAEAIRLEGEIEEFKKERHRLTFRNKVRPNSRNRQSVSQAIDRAIGEIGEKDPELAAHLKEKIRKGMECIYSDKQTPWEF